MRHGNLFLATAALLLSCSLACAAPPTAGEHPASAAPVGAPWDGEPGAADYMTAEGLVAAVLAASPALRASEAEADAVHGRIAIAGALDDPQLGFGIAPRTLGQGNRMQVSVSQPLPWPGKRGLRAEAAEWQSRAVREDWQAQTLALTEQARVAYARWFHAHRAASINRAQQALLTEIRQVAETRYTTGLGAQRDIIRAEVAHANLEAIALSLEGERAAAAAVINALLGREAGAAVPAPGTLPPPRTPPPLPELIEHARTLHPELRAHAHRIAGADAQTALVRRQSYPDLSLTTSYDQTMPVADERWIVGIGINLPLDLGGKRRAEIDAAHAESRRLAHHHADLTARLLADVEEARSRAEKASALIELYRERLLPLAESALYATLAAYRAGDGSFMEVLDAQRERLDLEDAMLRYRVEQFVALARLDRWTGRPFSRAADSPAEGAP